MILSNLSDRGTLRGSLMYSVEDYNILANKPQINSNELVGNKTGHQLGLANLDDIIYVEANPAGTPSEDLTKLQVGDVIYNIAGQIVYGDASGTIASFDDGGDNKPLKSLVIGIEPVQDLHGYDSPWVGGAGKNKLKYPYYASSTTLNGVTFTVNDDGTVNVNGTATADASFYLAYTGSDVILPQGEYTLNGCPSGGRNSTYMLNITNISTQDIGSGANFTSNGTTSLNIRIIVRANTTVSNLLFKPMIRLASVTDASYAPYSNICPISGWDAVNVTVADDVDNPTTTKTITIQLGDTYYGGKLDVTSGVLTVEWVGVDMGQQDYVKNATYANVFNLGLTNDYKIKSNTSGMCEIYKLYDSEVVAQYEYGFAISRGLTTIFFKNKDYTEPADFKTAMNGRIVIWELFTPQTIQLTPTQIKSLLGQNNLFVDSGQIISGQYFAEL